MNIIFHSPFPGANSATRPACKGASNMGIIIATLIVTALLFFVIPRFMNQQPVSRPAPQEEKTGPAYVDAYHKGTQKAQAIVDASKDRH